MTFKQVKIGERFVLKTDVIGGMGPFRKVSARRVVGIWQAVLFTMKDLNAPIAECFYCSNPLVGDEPVDIRGNSAAHKICLLD